MLSPHSHRADSTDTLQGVVGFTSGGIGGIIEGDADLDAE